MSVEQEGRKLDSRKRYSEQRKTAALATLAQNGGNRYRTAKQLGIPESTLASWARKAQMPGKPPKVKRSMPQIDENAPFDDQLEQVARQMVSIMPEKVEESSLQELTRSLSIVLATMKEARAGKDEKDSEEDVYEKLHKLMAHLASAGIPGTGIPTAVGDSEAATGE